MIVVTGSDGIVGRALCLALRNEAIPFLPITHRRKLHTDPNALVADLTENILSLEKYCDDITAIVHLAGALGRPVHVLLQKNPDWRWLTRESDSVWYPTAQLFRQQELGDWSEPVSRVCSEIGSLMKTGVSVQRKSDPRGKATRKAG